MSAGPAVTVVSTGSSTPAPSIIVNNAPPRQQTRSEEEDSGVRQSPSGQSESSLNPTASHEIAIYLIAARNGIVWAALAYWVDGPTLHFITVKGERKQFPLAQIDRELSEQFNRERKCALPATLS